MKTRILSLIAALLVTGPLGIAQEFTLAVPGAVPGERGDLTAPVLAFQGDKDIHIVRSTGYMQIPPVSQIRFNLDPVSLNLFPPELVMRNQKAIELEGEQKNIYPSGNPQGTNPVHRASMGPGRRTRDARFPARKGPGE